MDFNLLRYFEDGHRLSKLTAPLSAQYLHTGQLIPRLPASISVPEGRTIDPRGDYVSCLALGDPRPLAASLQKMTILNECFA